MIFKIEMGKFLVIFFLKFLNMKINKIFSEYYKLEYLEVLKIFFKIVNLLFLIIKFCCFNSKIIFIN